MFFLLTSETITWEYVHLANCKSIQRYLKYVGGSRSNLNHHLFLTNFEFTSKFFDLRYQFISQINRRPQRNDTNFKRVCCLCSTEDHHSGSICQKAAGSIRTLGENSAGIVPNRKMCVDCNQRDKVKNKIKNGQQQKFPGPLNYFNAEGLGISKERSEQVGYKRQFLLSVSLGQNILYNENCCVRIILDFVQQLR